MKSSIAHTYLYQLIILYVVIVFAILAAAVNYYKAFKVNTNVISIIEKYEGYNRLAKEEISATLERIGYAKNYSFECRNRNGVEPLAEEVDYPICVYEYNDTVKGEKEGSYYSYSVVSYIYVDIPFMDVLKLPVHTKGERIYKFSEQK